MTHWGRGGGAGQVPRAVFRGGGGERSPLLGLTAAEAVRASPTRRRCRGLATGRLTPVPSPRPPRRPTLAPGVWDRLAGYGPPALERATQNLGGCRVLVNMLGAPGFFSVQQIPPVLPTTDAVQEQNV
eukprot:EG_transcript_7466